MNWDVIGLGFDSEVNCFVVVQSLLCLTLLRLFCNPLGSSVYKVSQAKILEWVDISFSRESSWPRDGIRVSCIGTQVLYHWATQGSLQGKWRWLFWCFRWRKWSSEMWNSFIQLLNKTLLSPLILLVLCWTLRILFWMRHVPWPCDAYRLVAS